MTMLENAKNPPTRNLSMKSAVDKVFQETWIEKKHGKELDLRSYVKRSVKRLETPPPDFDRVVCELEREYHQNGSINNQKLEHLTGEIEDRYNKSAAGEVKSSLDSKNPDFCLCCFFGGLSRGLPQRRHRLGGGNRTQQGGLDTGLQMFIVK